MTNKSELLMTRGSRRFVLNRETDETGVSGTGYVADGIQFQNGKCVLCWRTEFSSVAVYDDIDSLIKIHGHDGKTVVVWIDSNENKSELYVAAVILEPIAGGMQMLSQHVIVSSTLEDFDKELDSWVNDLELKGYKITNFLLTFIPEETYREC